MRSYDETEEERAARIQTRRDEAIKHVAMTPGQAATIQHLQALNRVAYWAEARAQAQAQYRQALQDAQREGHGCSRIARAAGVTRQAIHSQLRKREEQA